MSKATYKFDLSDPDDRDEFLRTVKATDMAMVLWEITYNLRKRMENEYEMMPDEEYDKLRPLDVVRNVMDEIFIELGKRDLDVDNLIR